MDIKKLLNEMTLDEKLSQMIVVRGFNFPERINEMLDESKIGAIGATVIQELISTKSVNESGTVILKSGTCEQAVEIINGYIKRAKVPLMLYIDAEWGVAQIFPFATRFPPQMALGAARSPELAYENARAIAKELQALGFSIVSNPVLDINSNPKNPIINTRAFGDNPELIVELGRAYLHGLQDSGIIPTGKHYPGHGDTDSDSHVSMPIVRRDRETLEKNELYPYRILANEMWGVMTAHILYPSLLKEGEAEVPATMSRTVIYDLLRNDMGYKGLIVSDSLTMHGIKQEYGIEVPAIESIKAGHDIILQDYESDPQITFDAVKNAVQKGEIPMSYIDESVERILKFKERIDTLTNKPIDLENVKKVVGSDEIRAVSHKVAMKGVTLLESNSLPLYASEAGETLIISTVSEEEGGQIVDFGLGDDSSSGRVISSICGRVEADCIKITEDPSDAEIDALIARCGDYDNVIFASFIRVVAYKSTSGSVTQNQLRLIKALSEQSKCFIFMVFGSPYILSELPRLKNCIVSYGDDEFSIDAAVQAVFGEFEPTGRLPVAVEGRYPYGYRYESKDIDSNSIPTKTLQEVL